MRAIFFIFFSLCVLRSQSADATIELSDKNFDDVVLKSEVPVMVEFFAPWCGHCQSLAPEWEKAAKNLKGILPITKVDCTQHAALCSKYGVRGYPSIKCFSEKGKKVQDYQQARQASAIVKYATDQLTNKVVSIKDSSALDKFLETSSDLPHVILFTSKSDVSPLMKVLAIKYGGRTVIGQVQQTVADVVSKYNVESFPKLISVKGGETTNYDGSITPEDVSNFVASVVGDETVASTEGEKTEAEKPKPKPATPPPKLNEVNEENLDSECEKFSLCIVGLVDVNEDKKVKDDQLEVLQGVVNDFKGDKKFGFVWADRATSESLVKKFSANADQPTFIVYSHKKVKYAKAENFEKKSIHQLLERVLGGDVVYTKL